MMSKEPEPVPVKEKTSMVELIKKSNIEVKELNTIYNTGRTSQIEVKIDSSKLLELATYLKESGWPYITSLAGVDYPEREGEELEVVYHFCSHNQPDIICVKTTASYNDPSVPSLANLYPSVNFHERETSDMFGIKFPNHPTQLNQEGLLPHLLLPEDWPQYEDDPPYPFRKEYAQKPRPFEKVTDTRGHQGEPWEKYHRKIDRSGWLDEYYQEETPLTWYNTKRPFRADTPVDELTETEKPEPPQEKPRKHF